MQLPDDQIGQTSKSLATATAEAQVFSAGVARAIHLPAEGKVCGGPHRRKFVWFAALVAAVVIHSISYPARAEPAKTAVPASQPAEPWAKAAPERWPQIVLTNKASFTGHTPLEGPSAFLMRMPDGEILVGTAKHLIKSAGGVEPPIPLADLDRVLTRWEAFPRTKPTLTIEGKGLAENTGRENAHDWLLVRLVDPRAKLPATPLTPRLKPAEVGETVYLIGVPYTDQDSGQNVYKGVVTGRSHRSYFTYEFTPPVHIPGFSGAPIVDANGLLLGHDGFEAEFSAEDASLAVQLWQHRNDPPTTQPADAVHLDLPQGWVTRQSKAAGVIKYADFPAAAAFVELVAIDKADTQDDLDLMGCAAILKRDSALGTTLVNRQETELKAGNIGGRATIEYEITGAFKGAKLHYRIIVLEQNGFFCKFTCLTSPALWDVAQGHFEDAVKALK